MDDRLTALAKAATQTCLGYARAPGHLRECPPCAAKGRFETLAPALAILAHKQHEALERHACKPDSGLEGSACFEWTVDTDQEPHLVNVCERADIIAAYDKLEAKIPEVPRG